MKKLLQKHKELVLYLVFGVITTIASLLAWAITLKLGVNYSFLNDGNGNPNSFLDVLGSTAQWIVGVIVAFITNKYIVFKERQSPDSKFFKQLAIFSSSRVATYFLEIFINIPIIQLLLLFNYSTINLSIFGFPFALTARIWAKAVSSILVVIGNYYISKLFIFKKTKDKPETAIPAELTNDFKLEFASEMSEELTADESAEKSGKQ